MARWSVVNSASLAEYHGVVHLSTSSLIAFLSTLIVFSVCVTMLLALCAAHSSSHSHHHVLNARREYSSEPEAFELAIAPPEEFKKEFSKELSFRLSSANSSVLPKLSSASAAINRLSSSFRISSFRDPSSSFRNSSFRISSLRMDTCKQVDGVDHVLRRVRRGGMEEESTEPAVWQRAILRGERCAPLSFSGLILYDENGNQLPSFREETKQPDLHCNDEQPTMGGVRTPRFGSPVGRELETGF